MAAAGKPEDAGGRDLRRRAAQLEDELPYAVGGDRDRMRRECADAYLSCARSLLGGAAAGSGAEGDGKAALECLEKAAEINGLWHACADVCAQHAKARQKSGLYAEACAWFGQGVSLSGRAGDSQGQKARKRRQALRDRCIECWEELVKDPAKDMDGPYRTALLADPSRSQTHIDMGYVLAGRGDAGRAAECYEAACGADPGSAEARLRAGTALAEAGQHTRAAARYAEAAGIDPVLSGKAAMGCAQSGRSLAAMGRHADAAAALESAAALDPAHDLECAGAHERCAGAARGGDAADAQYEVPPGMQGGAGGAGIGADAHYARASELYLKGSGGEDAAEAAAGCARCGRALRERGRLEEAATALEAAAGIDPSHALECAEACEACGAAALRAGGADAAADHYQRAARWYSGPAGGGGAIGDSHGCLRCGRALAKIGRLEEAAVWIGAAAELDPAHAPECARAHEECGAAALRSGPGGRDDEAAGHYTKAVSWHQRIRAGDAGGAAEAAAGCARCGRALADMGRLAEAAEALGEAAKLDPSHAPECAEAHERCAAEARSRRGGDAGKAAGHYAEAARWYRRAPADGGAEKAAAGCARCGRALGEMGWLEAAAEAHAGAAALDPSLALEQARACMDMADRAGAGKGRGVRAGILRLALECCGGAGGGEKSPGLRLAAADILLDMGRHEEAAAEYGRAFGEDQSLRPRCGGGCIRCGDGLVGDSRVSEAVACVRGAQAAGMIGPEECEDALARWGRALFAESRYGEAAACFKAGAEAGGSAASWLGLAASLSGDGRHAEAAAAYGEAPAEERRGPGPRRFAAEASGSAGGSAACLAIADALLEEGMHGDAEGWYARARKGGTGAERSRAYVGIARSLHAKSMHAPAYDSLLMAAAAAAGGGAGTGRLCADVGAGLEGEGLHDRAAECYKMAAEMDAGMGAECAEGCLRAGGALEKAGRRKDAIACYEAASRIDAGSHAAHFAIADAATRDGNYNRAEWHYEAAGKCGGNAARAEAGTAMCRASDLYKRARDEVDMPTKRRLYVEAEDAYAEAARRSPEGPEALIGAGKACLKQRSDVDNLRRAEEYFAGAIALDPRLLEAHLLAGKAARKHAQGTGDRSRYADAMRYYDAAIERRPDRAIVPKYWRGVCMLCGGEDGDEAAREFLGGALDGAEPANSEERHYCGKICDILGRHGEAAEYYLGSLEGSRLYSAGFYSRIDRGRVRSGRAAGGGAAVGGPRDAGTGGEVGGAPDLQYVCDANVVISYLDHLARGTVFEGSMVPMFEKRQCFVPQVCYNEAYGKVAGNEQRSRMLHDAIGPLCTVIKGRGRMDMRMQRAREAFMSAWLYSSEDEVREWCMHADDKAAKKSARYAGGPPSGRDVLVLATAVDMHVNPARPASTSLVTWDKDFTTFGDHIRAETGVEVVRPEDVGR